MSTPLAVGNGLIGGGGITYTYTDFELTAAIGDGTIDAPDINISLSAQTAALRTGSGTIGAGLPILAFDDYSAELVTGFGTIGAGPTHLRDIVRALFPALSPSDRRFELPEYALSKYKAMNGAKSRRLWASQPGGGTLDLTFENIDDADAESILAAHDAAKGVANDVILPDAVLSGAEGDLLAYMRSPGSQAWSFDKPPEIDFVNEGISTVRVRLSARRKVQFNSFGSVGRPFAVGAAPVDEIDPLSFTDCDFIGRAAEEGPNPRPGRLWVSKLASGGAYSLAGVSSIEHDLLGNSYQVVGLNSGGFRIGIVKRSRTGAVLWQRVSGVTTAGFSFAEIKALDNGNIVIHLAEVFIGSTRQRLLLLSPSGTLIRSRAFLLGWPGGMRLRDQSSVQIWGSDVGIVTGGRPFLLTLSIEDSAAFGDVIAYHRYDTPDSASTATHRAQDVRRLANGNLIMLARFQAPALAFYCLELMADGATLAQVAALENSPSTTRNFTQVIPYADGSFVLTAVTDNVAARVNSSLNVVWYRNVEIPGSEAMYPLLDATENLYYAARAGAGAGGAPPGFVGSPGASIQRINQDFTTVSYSTWSSNGDGPSSYQALGSNSGLDLANGRFIGCSASGNNVTSHQIVMSSSSAVLPLSGGQTASAGTQTTVASPTAHTDFSLVRTVPTISITAPTLTYEDEALEFADPGGSLAWDLFVSP